MHRKIAFGTTVSLVLAAGLAALGGTPGGAAADRARAGAPAAPVGAEDQAGDCAERAEDRVRFLAARSARGFGGGAPEDEDEDELLAFLLESAAGHRFATPADAKAWWGEVRAARAGLRRVLAQGELEPGALVQYYANLELRGAPVVVDRRPEVRVEAHNEPYPGVPADFSSRWYSRLEVPAAGPHSFSMWIDDGARIWIDGRVVFDELTYTHAWRQLGPLELSKGLHEIVVEHLDSNGPASIYLTWKTPGAAAFEPVPWELFHVPAGLEAAVKRLHAALAPAAPASVSATPFEALSTVR